MPFDSLKSRVNTILANEAETVDQRLTEICELLQTAVGYYAPYTLRHLPASLQIIP